MSHRIALQSLRRLPGIGLALAALAFVPASRSEAQIVTGTTITVNTTWDGYFLNLPGQPPAPPPCRLRDAIQAANTNLAVGGCPAGKRARVVYANPLRVEDVDRIVFNVGTGTPDIVLKNTLPEITDAVTIDGATGGATRVEISGENLYTFLGLNEGIVVTGSFTTLKSLVVNGFNGSGIVLTAKEGELVIVTPARPERPDEIPGHLDPCGPNAFPSDPSQCPPPGGNPDDQVIPIAGPGGGSNTVIDCLVGTNAAGNAAVPNGNGTSDTAGIMVLTSGNTIGHATDPKLGNVISGNRGHGVLLQGSHNHVLRNKIGTGIATNVSLPNDLDGVFVAGGQFANAPCEILANTIFFNREDGIDAGYNICGILANQISSNGELGIDRAQDGVTANDPLAPFFRRPPNFPEILQVTTTLFPAKTTISGFIHQRAPGPITIELFYSSSCDPSGHGEGATYLGSKDVAGSPSSTQPAAFSFSTNKALVSGYYTATATTEKGTSEFSVCYRK